MTAVEFTKDEATALLHLLDIAVKAGGLQVAEASAVLARKIAVAAQELAQNPVEAPVADA